ncbi:hypothetical protein VOLCADRAFT_121645 [Volvox carteri f. nagariensis]|uniref:Uncharacterized protein n=1 Tax=Volvox carteri f. nagariensis TaxID=3068 RepID=D8UG30_VOLCA|nr:uncharacterized protein VOLCADRAFT_121645 [Volvox carteri f. nagariensis]EFJ41279.1 hypothetical protein VOLCADRAFT_121645 [Volvox carteri f. nagariensis]|eukprot:XP_002957613.1 hypothetical protein VOLCADRAFT_121645 [Volvox carteri f. nagariensis]
MTSTLQPYRTTPVCHLRQRGFSVLCPRPCNTNQTRSEVRTKAFRLGNPFGAGASSRQQQTALVAPDRPPASSSKAASNGVASFPVIAIAAVGVAGLITMVFKKIRNNGLDDNTARYSVNMHLANVMKDVNTVRIEDLSLDQIEAARARRSKERANHKLSLEEIELPQNHPFATKQKLSKEEQEQSLQNLRARSMRRRNYDAMQTGVEGGRASSTREYSSGLPEEHI